MPTSTAPPDVRSGVDPADDQLPTIAPILGGLPAGRPVTVDLHQHLWPEPLVEALRRRRTAPRLDGWTLHLPGEPPYEVDPADHDPVARRSAADTAFGADSLVLLSLSSPLGVEALPVDEAAPLLELWHDGAAALAPRFGAWASVSSREPDLDALADRLTPAGGFVGLQVPATDLLTPAAVERLAPVLAVAQAADRPVFVHPGPAPAAPDASTLPPWWAATVDYPAQLQAAWWAWLVAGRSLLPRLRICFGAAAGLAPLQHERHTARGGRPPVVDPLTFVEVSSYGEQGLDGLLRALGIDPLVFGTDTPYVPTTGPAALPALRKLGPAAERAVRSVNPLRLLTGRPLEGPTA